MKYPKYAFIHDKQYQINTDYHVALECLQIIEDESIGDSERTYAIIYKLFGMIPEDQDMHEFIRIAGHYLGCGEQQEVQKQRKRDMDFQQDWKYIVASFMSDYHIDIQESHMHWYQFIHFIQGFTEESMMSRIRELRNYDLSDIKDQKVKRKVMEAQKGVELSAKLSSEDQKAVDEFESLFI